MEASVSGFVTFAKSLISLYTKLEKEQAEMTTPQEQDVAETYE